MRHADDKLANSKGGELFVEQLRTIKRKAKKKRRRLALEFGKLLPRYLTHFMGTHTRPKVCKTSLFSFYLWCKALRLTIRGASYDAALP